MEGGQGLEEHNEAMDADVESNPALRENLPSHLTEELAENLVVAGSTVFRTKEERKETHRLQVYHEAIDQDVELNPEVWEKLPNDLIDVIVEKVLSRLPFSRILTFCSVCKQWTNFLLSQEYLLFFSSFDECMILNPRTGLWESMPLPFSQVNALMLQTMELQSCVGGLLYFTTAVLEEFIVCNPLTRLCRTIAGIDAARQIGSAELKTTGSYPSDWRISFREVWDELPFSTHYIAVKLITSSDRGPYDLLVAKHYERYGMPSVKLNVKDSRRTDWVTVPDVHRDFHFIVFPTVQWLKTSVMLGFSTCPKGFNVLLYDGNEQRCFWYLNAHSLGREIETNRKTLFAILNGGGQLEFVELRDGGATLEKAPFPPPTELLQKNIFYDVRPNLTIRLELAEILNFVNLQQGNIVFHICLFRQAPEGPLNISVLRHSLVDGSEHISNWMECRPSTWKLPHLPTSRKFLILKPSLSCP